MKYLIIFLFTVLPFYTWGAVDISLPGLPENIRSSADELYHMISKQAYYRLQQVKMHQGRSDMKLLTPSIHGEHGIRPNTGAVLGFSFLYRFGNYEEKTVGVSKELLLSNYIIPMMNYLTLTYDSIPTSDGKCWNRQWQSAHWAYSLGKAAWYLGEALPQNMRERVYHIIRMEAKRFYDVVPPHRIKNNTAAEENAWNSQIFHIASLLMPEDSDYSRWQDLFKKWVLSSYVTESDVHSDKAVDGFKLNRFEGGNIYDDYTLENHDIVHPDYMSAFILSFQTAVDYRMIGKEVPAFLLFNVAPIYSNLKWFALPDGGMTYPSGQDWGIFRNPDWLINHVYMAVFANDPDAWHYARETFECIRLMQQRHPEGNIYSAQETEFPSTQSDIMIYLLHTWQALHFSQNIKDEWQPLKGVKSFENGKILLNKSDHFIHSLCYGNQIMFLPTLNAADRFFDAFTGSGMGIIRLKGGGTVLPVKLQDIQLKKKHDRYEAKLTLMYGNEVEANYLIKALPDKLEVKETYKALTNCDIESIETARFGILNNPMWIREDGKRILSYEKQSHEIQALSGIKIEFLAKQLKIDQVNIKLKNRKPGFYSLYKGASQFKAGRATDILALNYKRFHNTINKGDVFSELSYVIDIQ